MKDKGYDYIRFVATIVILIYHFYTTLSVYPFPLEIEIVSTIFSLLGYIGVALFTFLSGALLWHNYGGDTFSIPLFFRKRFVRMIIPQCIAFGVFFFCQFLVNPVWVINSCIKENSFGTFISLFGFFYAPNLYTKLGVSTVWLVGEWYTSVILVIYILFPLFRWLFKKHRLVGSLIMVVVYVLNYVYYHLYATSDILMSYFYVVILFWVGMLFQEYKNKIKPLFLFIDISVIIVIFVLVYLEIIRYSMIVSIVFSLAIFIALYHVNFETKFIRCIAKYNYEIYLIHHRVFIIIMPFMIADDSNIFKILIVFLVLSALILLMSVGLNIASKILKKE